MRRIPIEHKGKLKVIQNQFTRDVYAVPEINNNLTDPEEKIVQNFNLVGEDTKEVLKLMYEDDIPEVDFNIDYDSFIDDTTDDVYLSPKNFGLGMNDKVKFAQDADKDSIYVIGINDTKIHGNKYLYNYKEYVLCYSCESIRQRMENNENPHPFAVQGWDYVRTAEEQNYHSYAPEKIDLLNKMGFDELQGGLWCRECGSAVLAKTFIKEHENHLELSFSANKGDKQIDKIVFKLPGKSHLSQNTNFSSLGNLVIYRDFEMLNDITIVSIGPSDYTLTVNNVVIGTIRLNSNRNEISLMIDRDGDEYSENRTYSIFIHKIWFLKLDQVDKYDVLQTATFDVVNNNDIFYKRYVGYVKLNQYNPVHDPEDDWDEKWPIEEDDDNGGGHNPGGSGIKNVLVWGLNTFGQLGDGTVIDRVVHFNSSGQIITPANPVLNLMTDAKIVKAGKDHAVALKEDNTLWVWGRNTNGQLGLGFRDDSHHSFPAQITDLGNIIDIAGGWFHTVALEGDGSVWSWGGNYKGQLGDGTNTAKSRPVQVKLQNSQILSGIVAISAGSEHTIALDNSGHVWEWGEDQFYPKMVDNLTGIIAISTGSWHSIALKSDGTVWAWGYNWSGQIGIGFDDFPDYQNEKGEYIKAIQVLGLTDVIAIDCGSEHSLALKSDGTLWSWGNNSKGQLGISTININKYYPVRIQELSNVKIFSAGEYHNFAALEDKSVWAWGDNSQGQLCLNNHDLQKLPIKVEIIPEIKYINCGNYHNFAIKVTDKT